MAVAQECIQKRAVRYDKNGDNHYDTISAFIKSMRGSDPDAAVYYLARMLYAGEDIKFIARRIMICAAGKCGPTGPCGGGKRSPGRRAHRNSRGQYHPFPGSDLCGHSSKEQRCLYGVHAGMVEEPMDMPVPGSICRTSTHGARCRDTGQATFSAHDYPKHCIYIRLKVCGMKSILDEPLNKCLQAFINAQVNNGVDFLKLTPYNPDISAYIVGLYTDWLKASLILLVSVSP